MLEARHFASACQRRLGPFLFRGRTLIGFYKPEVDYHQRWIFMTAIYYHRQCLRHEKDATVHFHIVVLDAVEILLSPINMDAPREITILMEVAD